uniref:Serine protease K12H4.7 n=1 Tax=Loa loa TaxID=7209 RepID=A0A1I7VMQ1_LOALO
MLPQQFLIICYSLFYRCWSVQGSERPVDRDWRLPLTPQLYLEISHLNNAENAIQHRLPPLSIGRSSLKQKLDHFDNNDGRKWRQFYTHRKSPYQRSDGAVFLIVGGEDGADRAWLTNQGLPYVQLADQINASIFMLEHRFYGSSRPTIDTSIQSLKYLDAKQAVEDIDRFVQEINQREKLTNPKWITFGGSYSGNLAAWAREKHPRSIRAAVASSAPLQAKLNFKGKKFLSQLFPFSIKKIFTISAALIWTVQQYTSNLRFPLAVVTNQLEIADFERQIEKIIEKKDTKCVAVIRKLFQKMRQMSTTHEGRRKLVKIFRLDDSLIRPAVSDKDVANFFLVISNYISFIVMHSGINVKDHRDLLTLDVMCSKLTHSPSLESIRELIGMVMASQGKSSHSAIDIGYNSFLDFMRDERWNTRNAQPRAWLYQNCHEFGHFRTSEEANGLFGGTLPLSFFLARCKDVFGGHFSLENTEKRIAETNEYFGGNQHFQATDVILSNGSDDPWTLLGIYNGTSAIGNFVICIEGTSHVADFYPPSNFDSNALRNAQYKIIRVIEDIVL